MTPAGQPLPLPAGHTQTGLFLDTLAEHPPAGQFASPAQRRAFKLARIRRVASTVAMLFLLASLPMAASQMIGAHRLRTESAQLRQQEAAWQGLAAAGRGAASALPAATLRQITERYAELIRQQRQPAGAYRKLSGALDHHPGIQLESLDWQADGGRESLVVHGNILPANTDSGDNAQAVFAHFVAALAVDRASTLHVRQGPPQGERPGEAAPAPQPFTLEIRQTP